jgi:hypothetical protein
MDFEWKGKNMDSTGEKGRVHMHSTTIHLTAFIHRN